MKRFKRKNKNNIMIIIFLIIVFDVFLFYLFIDKLGYNIAYTAKLKVEELTKYHLNSTIKKFLNINTNDYIKLNFVNNNIVNVDIDNNSCNKLLNDIIIDIENNIKNIEKGNINDYHNLEMLRGNNGVIVLMPMGVILNNSLFSRLGPRIPIKISFLENLNAFVDIEVVNYGINNSLIKLFINIEIEEVVELPIEKNRNIVSYKYLIASKLVNGEVPNMLGGVIKDNSNIVNKNVNK